MDLLSNNRWWDKEVKWDGGYIAVYAEVDTACHGMLLAGKTTTELSSKVDSAHT